MAKVSLRAYDREIETMIDRGQLEEAVAHCRHILKTYPKHLETYRLLGKAYLEAKRYPDAADIFSRILVAVPDDFVAHVGMSIIRDEDGKLDDAIWHMERAFETQPSNPAIQSELQRLYGLRDGVQPPRIRMTRGALAHMYVHGELYPQAISEIKSVLSDDPGRSDMQALQARAYYKSGLKNEAADAASTLLRRYPYALDANRVLTEILSADRPENAQVYRQRVHELDPYAAQVTGTVFQSNEVSDAAVNIERLDWNGQPVAMQPDWGETSAIRLESGREEQPDWFRDQFQESRPSVQPAPPSMFESTAPPPPTAAQPADEIPEFLRQAGWGQATGTFDESKSAFGEQESVSDAQPIEQGDLPDWVRAMKPAENESASQQEEPLPDWIDNIGKGALSTEAAGQFDWLNQPQQETPTSEPASLEWMDQLEQPAQAATGAAEEQPDWLRGFGGETESSSAATPAEETDWLKGLSAEPLSDIIPQPAQTETPDWLKTFDQQPDSTPTAADERLDWLKQLETEETAAAASPSEFDFLNQLSEEPVLNIPEETASTAMKEDALGLTEEEQDDSFAWLESLAARQGATEGLLTPPEQRQEEEPEWVKQAKELNASQPPSTAEAPVERSASLIELGKSEQEQDDSFAWLESLAAKQGATEGLLTKPEERREEEPEWVRQAKELNAQPSMPTAPAGLEELGKSEQEQDDSFAWLESLAAKQGATEGLLTKPEERRDAEPEWVRQAKDLGEQRPALDDTAAWLKSLEEEARQEEPAPKADETAMWLKGLEEKEQAAEQEPAAEATPDWLEKLEQEESRAVPAADETAMWLKSLEEADASQAPGAEPATAEDALPAWLESIEQEEIALNEVPVSQEQAVSAKAPDVMEEPQLEEESIPNWLADLDKEEERPVSAAVSDEDLPAWLRAEEAAPESTEPTRATDWRPAQVEQPEIVYSPAVEKQQPEIIYSPPLEEQPEPQPAAAELQAQTEAERVPELEPAMRQEPEIEHVPASYKEPVTRRATSPVMSAAADPVLTSARNDLSRSNIPAALDSYSRLIKKGRFLDEVIYDLREALYRYPVDVNIWQALGDAYMRANRLQDALDAYTKAEELLR